MEDRWFDEELSGCRLGDGRLDSRLRQLVEQMESGFGESIPLACQDWANTKAAYRFFSNDRMSEEDILRGHFDATRRRFAASDGPILILHDTTEFGLSLHRDKTRLVEFGRFAVMNRCQRGVGKPEAFDFLGFTHYCTMTRRGRFRLGRKPVAKRVNRTLACIDGVLRKRWHHDIWEVGKWRPMNDGYRDSVASAARPD